MDNTRYRNWITPLAIVGAIGAVVLFINAAKRGGLIPPVTFVQLISPLGAALGIGLVIGFHLWSRRTTRLAEISTALLVLALTFQVGAEFFANFVGYQSSPEQLQSLLAGPLGPALTIASLAFGLAAPLWAIAHWGTAPWWALSLMALGSLAIGLRSFVPPYVFVAGVAALGAGVLALSITMLTHRAPSVAAATA